VIQDGKPKDVKSAVKIQLYCSAHKITVSQPAIDGEKDHGLSWRTGTCAGSALLFSQL